MTNIEELKRKALTTKPLVDGSSASIQAFYAAASPDVVLSLITQIEAQSERIDHLEKLNMELRAWKAAGPLDNMAVVHTSWLSMFDAQQAALVKCVEVLKALAINDNYDEDGCFTKWDDYPLEAVIAEAEKLL